MSRQRKTKKKTCKKKQKGGVRIFDTFYDNVQNVYNSIFRPTQQTKRSHQSPNDDGNNEPVNKRQKPGETDDGSDIDIDESSPDPSAEPSPAPVQVRRSDRLRSAASAPVSSTTMTRTTGKTYAQIRSDNSRNPKRWDSSSGKFVPIAPSSSTSENTDTDEPATIQYIKDEYNNLPTRPTYTYEIKKILTCGNCRHPMNIETLKKQLNINGLKHFDSIKNKIYEQLQFTDNRNENFLYWCEINYTDGQSNISDGMWITHSIIKYGLKIKYILNKSIKKNHIDFVNNTLTIYYNNTDFFTALDTKSKYDTNQIYQPSTNLLNNWWNEGEIFKNITEIKNIRGTLEVEINYKQSGGHPQRLNKSILKIKWEDAIKNQKPFIDQMDSELKLKINELLGFTSPKIEPTIMVTDDIIKNNLYRIIKDILSKHISLRQSKIGNTIGNARTEVEKLGFNIDKVVPASPCSYITNASLLNKLLDISPTSTNCINGYLTNGCICYGSQIIPQGIKAGKYTQNNREKDIYGKTLDPFLLIEVEHICHFIQMMIYGGSSNYKWEENIGIDINDTYIQEGLAQIKLLRELLYDISIMLYNQWKYNKELLHFKIVEKNNKIKIQVEINDELLTNLLNQTYNGTSSVPLNTHRSSKIKNNSQNLKNYIVDQNRPVFCMNGSNITQITSINFNYMKQKNIELTRKYLNKRVKKINDLLKKSDFDCKRLLLINCTAFVNMLNHLDDSLTISNYKFKEKLDDEVKDAAQKRGGKSKKQKGGTSNKDLIDAVNNFYNLFQFPDDNETMDYIAMVEELFTTPDSEIQSSTPTQSVTPTKTKTDDEISDITTKMQIDDEESGTRTPIRQIQNPILIGSSKKGGKKKTRKKRKKKRKTLKIKRKDLKTKP